MIKICPSILSGDFACLGAEAARMAAAGADMLHIDVMDGVFVPNLTIGAPVIRCLKPHSPIPLDVHLMIHEPERLLGDFLAAGSDSVTIHCEATGKPDQVLKRIRDYGARAALAIKPGTPAKTVFPYLEHVSMVLVMTVEPGFGGQKLIPETVEKVAEIRRECDRRGIHIDIQVDGGINGTTIAAAARAGANVFVAGNAVFNAPDSAVAVADLRTTAQNAYKK